MVVRSSGSETLPGRKQKEYIILDRKTTIVTVWTNFLNKITVMIMALTLATLRGSPPCDVT